MSTYLHTRRLALSFNGLLLIVALGILGCAAFKSTATKPPMADQQNPPIAGQPKEEPAIVKVGVYVLNVGSLDISTGDFIIDFYLSLSSNRPINFDNFEFSNGRAKSIDKTVDEPTEKFYRIRASLGNSLNLSRFPFDLHGLTIELEDKEHTTRSLVYQVNLEESGIDPYVDIAGWVLDGWKAEVKEHYYAPYKTTFSRYTFRIDIHRAVLAAILKTIFPALIIVMVGLLSLVLAPNEIISRLTLNTGSLVGAVLFHLNMTSSLPPLGYMTFGDRFMLINYISLTLSLVSILVASFYVDKKQTTGANRVHKLSLIVVPLVWIGLQTYNFLLI